MRWKLHKSGFALTVAAILLGSNTCFAAVDIAEAQHALMQGRVAEVISSMQSFTAISPRDGQAHLLLCRAYYAEGLPDPAVRECEAALMTLSNNSLAQEWMGRVYGLKAERSGPLTGYNLAKKVKYAFEAAVNLDPLNGDAVDDLGDYFIQAPSLVGGGTDKALALATRVQGQLPQRAIRLRAVVAEKQKDYAAAEHGFKTLVENANGRADAWLDLGSYYARRHDTEKAVDALRHAITAERKKGAVLVIVAETFIKIQREPVLAAQILRDYLSGGNCDDTAPTFKARTLLGKLLASGGDKLAAKVEFDKALALAPEYDPARKALASL